MRQLPLFPLESQEPKQLELKSRDVAWERQLGQIKETAEEIRHDMAVFLATWPQRKQVFADAMQHKSVAYRQLLYRLVREFLVENSKTRF
jgi:hypothetical protein